MMAPPLPGLDARDRSPYNTFRSATLYTGDEPVQTQRQVRYLPQRLVRWWRHPSICAWRARLKVRVEQALEKVAQGG